MKFKCPAMNEVRDIKEEEITDKDHVFRDASGKITSIVLRAFDKSYRGFLVMWFRVDEATEEMGREGA